MGSVVVSDVVSDFARYPHTMVVGDHHDTAPAGSERHRASSSHSSASHSSSQHFAQQRYNNPASAHTPPLTSPAHSTRSASHNAHSSISVDAAAPHGASRRHHTELSQDFGASAIVSPHHGEEGYDRAGFPLTITPKDLTSSPPSPQLLPTIRSSLSFSVGSGFASPTRIKVRNLSHIQAFASEEVLTRSQHGSRRNIAARQEGGQQYEISDMPVTDIIEMVAGLLTKITSTNDRQHQQENINRHIPSNADGSSAINQQTASVLSFHGKNVPSITILSYLSRIHKYCPTTYEVFLSLLVYFDRMTEMINNGTLGSFRGTEDVSKGEAPLHPFATPPPSGSLQPQDHDQDHDLVDSDDEVEEDSGKLAHVFVVDSFNIHRLVIAGVTCASKFFSDVFYTNSRYAKVCLTSLFLSFTDLANVFSEHRWIGANLLIRMLNGIAAPLALRGRLRGGRQQCLS